MLDLALAYAGEHRSGQLERLFEFLRIPSVSNSPEHAGDVRRAAEWLAGHLRQIGMMRAEVMETGGHPTVYAEWLGAGPAARTLLIYSHYDVLPAGAPDRWTSPPFEPTVRGDDLVCRGASDDKGQLFATIAAIEACLQADGRVPVNVKFMFEGEEEQSSPNIAAFVQQHRERLAADAAFILDGALADPQTATFVYGVRGIAYLEVEVRGPAADAHSGIYGGAIDNPFNVLVRLLAQLQDGQTRRIAIPGFYDRVKPLDESTRRRVNQELSRAVAGLPGLTGVRQAAGEAGYTTAEHMSLRPTLDIHGIGGGFTGVGQNTIIPAGAVAKVSMRLVDDQDPYEIARLFEFFLRSQAPPTVELAVRQLEAATACVVDTDAPVFAAAERAFEAGFGARPIYLRLGGTLPVMLEMKQTLGIPVVATGIGLPDDNWHAPDEKLHLPSFHRGVETVIRFLHEYAQ